MYCPKCKHTGFDHLATCPKCGYDWQSIRTALNLNWLQSAGHDWLPESAPEPPEAEPEPTPAASPEPEDFKPDSEAPELFAFEEQAEDFGLSPPEAPLTQPDIASPGPDREAPPDIHHSPASEHPASVSEGIPTVAAPAQEILEIAPPETRIEPDVADDIPLDVDLSQAEFVHGEDADLAVIGQVEDTEPGFPKGAEPDDAGLPVWEIELPQDLLPQDYFPEPVGEEHGPVGTSDKDEQDIIEVAGDIAYDFSEVEVVLPDMDEEAQPSDSGDAASPLPSEADGGDAERPSAPLPSSDHKEGR